MRLDLLVVDRGLAASRSAAQRLIEGGGLRWRPSSAQAWRTPRKAGDDLPVDAEIQLVDDAELRWVSRAGLKLEGALQAWPIPVQGRCALDVGQSTGGFTEVLLHRGARQVVGVDVGHGQLHARVRADARVVPIEGLNARSLSVQALREAAPKAAGLPDAYGLIVADLSFISLTLVLPALAPLLAADGDAVLLIKPQFELQPAQIGRGGLVRDPALHRLVRERLEQAVAGIGWRGAGWMESPIQGGDGNTEFFLHAHGPAAKPATGLPLTTSESP